jgi:superfamily II DNA or RNA helicase/HKD family nuclease
MIAPLLARNRCVNLPEGLYDLLLTDSLAARLDPLSALHEPLRGNAAAWLGELIGRQLAAVLDELPGDDDQKRLAQLGLINDLLVGLRSRLAREARAGDPAALLDPVTMPARVLKSIRRDRQFPVAPELGLALPWLFTAGKGSPALLPELRRELASADSVDILVSFIKVEGVRKIADVLRSITAVDAGGRPSTRLRILTTTYTGATDAKALDELAALPGCELRVSYDGRRTRLHAKAWLFRRATGFGSAYVGSANLSGAAMTGGLEWTVKLTQRAQGALFERAVAHFETLWADGEFEAYDPRRPDDRDRLRAALARESGGVPADDSMPLRFFDLQPKSYQQEMLEQLAAERERGRFRNLLVAATGTGKTMVAAFDYRRLCAQVGGQPRLLFVAHREEILRQALRSYREVLRDPQFGELLVGGAQPASNEHLFATVASIASRGLVATLGADHWHTVVIDECHHLAASSFDAFATAIRPKLLLGLTATPERHDGQPLGPYFDMRPDGSPAVELRLWHALDLQLLSPFEYYACDDATDFAEVPWHRSGEREAIDRLVTGNDVRARLVVSEWQRLVADPRRSKALVFCVSVAHARFMTDWLNQSGLPAACVVGDGDPAIRERAPAQLARGELCAIVTVDLYNEGVDLPMVDTLLLLRPTQSPVLFQQQIGRGLRLSPGTAKDSCLVLDFVGQHRAEFRFDRLLGSLTGLSRRELGEAVEQGFGSLPPGCHIQLQKQTREQVLASLKALGHNTWNRLKTELQVWVAQRPRGAVTLTAFLDDQRLALDEVYRNGKAGGSASGWTTLKRDAGLMVAEPGPEEAYFSKRFAALLHVDDPLRLDRLAGIAADEPGAAGSALLDQMLAYQIDSQHGQTASGSEFIARLAAHPPIGRELAELTAMLKVRALPSGVPIPGLDDLPLCLHAAYGIREILTAVGWLTASRRTPFQSGLLGLPARQTELLFVTLDKSDGYHDRIAYHDYAISRERFHWQSQNSAGPNTKIGRRYVESAVNGWRYQLFVRERPADPYRACGPVRLESWEGDRPMSIVWALEVPLPARLFREYSVLRGA